MASSPDPDTAGRDFDREARAAVAGVSPDVLQHLLAGSTAFWPGVKRMGLGGYTDAPWPFAAIPDGLPGLPPALARIASAIHFSDGPRGVMLPGGTTLPAAIACGATFDVDLNKRIGRLIGRECRALGADFFAGVCVNLVRHPGWGRTQETFGEDSHHLAEMGIARTLGVQEEGVMACAKHYALNSIENSRFKVDVRADERTLYEVYLQHFERIVKEAEVASVMSAYNRVNGEWCGSSRTLLTDVLKDEWGFQGFTVSDFVFGIRTAGYEALNAGLEVEMPVRNMFSSLADDVRAGRVSKERLEDAAARVVRERLRFLGRGSSALLTDAEKKAHQDLAAEAAVAGTVLLKNSDNLLPLARGSKIHVVGRLARVPNLGDRGSSSTRPDPARVVVPLQGIKAAFGEANVTHSDDLDGAGDAAQAADALVVVVGRTWRDEGEFIKPDVGPGMMAQVFPLPRTLEDFKSFGTLAWAELRGATQVKPDVFADDELSVGFGKGGDVLDLHLSSADEALIAECAAANPKTIVVVTAGTTVLMERWIDSVGAVLMTWYPGEKGGLALGEILSGASAPSGRLPVIIPKDAEHLPYFDPTAETAVYDLFHGYRKLDRDGNKPLFDFGFGLTYTTFELSDPRILSAENGNVRCDVLLRNTGTREGAEVVQVYVFAEGSKLERAVRELKGFRKVVLPPGGEARVEFDFPRRRFEHYEPGEGWTLEQGCRYGVIFARWAGDPEEKRLQAFQWSS
ncbi:beta-glucosidase [Hyaloraphidium curvatum]|nr:beta-glucosidase [Hyaloraphidium curvatum]